MTDWVVWSEEHAAWWGPGHWGYTRSLREAGRYDQAEAVEIAMRGNIACRAGTFHEVAMPDPLREFNATKNATKTGGGSEKLK